MTRSKRYPRRTAICTGCRRLLPDGADCTDDRHEVVQLHRAKGWALLSETVWGEKILMLRPRFPWLWEVGLITGLVVSSFVGVASPWIGAVGITASLAGYLFKRAVLNQYREPVEKLRREPRALPAAFQLKTSSRPSVGTISDGEEASSPLLGVTGVAFDIVLGNNDILLWRDASSLGFVVETNDGKMVAIPVGPVVIIGTGQPVARATARRYVNDLAPRPRRYPGGDPFDFDHATELVFRVGDRVEIHNELQVASLKSRPLSYRDATGVIYETIGTPTLS